MPTGRGRSYTPPPQRRPDPPPPEPESPEPEPEEEEQSAAPPERPTMPPPRSANNDRPKLEKIGALWKRKSRAGNVYLAGVIHDQKVMIFPIKPEFRTSDKSPHYQVMTQAEVSDEDIPF